VCEKRVDFTTILILVLLLCNSILAARVTSVFDMAALAGTDVPMNSVTFNLTLSTDFGVSSNNLVLFSVVQRTDQRVVQLPPTLIYDGYTINTMIGR
jgi:hypothetical protein